MFNELQVGRDANGNSALDGQTTLAQNGVTELNYVQNWFTQDRQVKSMAPKEIEGKSDYRMRAANDEMGMQAAWQIATDLGRFSASLCMQISHGSR